MKERERELLWAFSLHICFANWNYIQLHPKLPTSQPFLVGQIPSFFLWIFPHLCWWSPHDFRGLDIPSHGHPRIATTSGSRSSGQSLRSAFTGLSVKRLGPTKEKGEHLSRLGSSNTKTKGFQKDCHTLSYPDISRMLLIQFGTFLCRPAFPQMKYDGIYAITLIYQDLSTGKWNCKTRCSQALGILKKGMVVRSVRSLALSRSESQQAFPSHVSLVCWAWDFQIIGLTQILWNTVYEYNIIYILSY